MKIIATRLASGKVPALAASIVVSMTLLLTLLETGEAGRELAQTGGVCANSIALSGYSDSTDLVSDCQALLASLDTLEGDVSLNWSADLSIDEWDTVVVSGSPGRVTELELWRRGLNGEIPPELGDLSALVELHLEGNQLTGTIPAELGELVNLELISLTNNQLTGTIPPELGNMTSMRRMHLNHNHLTGTIPSELGNPPSLELLHIGGNEFTGCIPQSLSDIDLDLREIGLPFCTDGEESPDPCIEEISVSGTLARSWNDNCASLHPNRSGSYARFFTFDLLDEANLTITLESTVDTYLYIREGTGKNGTVLHEDDDDDDNSFSLNLSTDSGISARLAAGSYTIEATTYRSGESGDFTLSVLGLPSIDATDPTPTPEPTPTDSCIESIRQSGTFDRSWVTECVSLHPDRSGSYARFFTFELSDAASVTVTLESTIDTFLYLREGAGKDGTIVDEDDDDDGGAFSLSRSTDSGISADLAAGSFTIEATTYSAGQSGDFTLTVQGLAPQSTTVPAPSPTVVPVTPSPSPTPAPTFTPVPTPSPTPIHTSEADRAALIALYNATGGQNWRNQDNWLSDAPLNSWQGVSADSSGRVILLVLENNNLTGAIPEEIGNLTQLRYLRLANNEITGPLPPQIGNFSDLRVLQLQENRLSGTIPSEFGNLNSLIILDIGHNQLTGAIPPELRNLDRLRRLYLGSNQLSGEIPAELGELVSLQRLVLGSNELAGNIPEELGDLTDLRNLTLDSNRLTGIVPTQIGKLTRLEGLYLHSNDLSGQLPQSLTDLTLLRQFFFDGDGGLCAPRDAQYRDWLGSVELVVGDTCRSRDDHSRAVFQGGVDLVVIYIERLPRYQVYRTAYFANPACYYPYDEDRWHVLCPGQEGLKRWPEAGEDIELKAHIWNVGDAASGSFEYHWSRDGETIGTGEHAGLEPGDQAALEFSTVWPDSASNPKLTFTVDPDDAIQEIHESNNALDDWMKGYTIGFYFDPLAYQSLTRSNESGQATQSPEHWVHRNIDHLNGLLIEAGLPDRVRTEFFAITDNHNFPLTHEQRYNVDGWWGLKALSRIYDLTGNWERPEIDFGLLHELLHQLGVIDLYQAAPSVDRVHLPDINKPKQKAGCGLDYWRHPRECYRFPAEVNDLMGGPNHWIGNHTAGGLRSNTGHRRGYYGEYLYDTPESTSIRVVNENGQPLSRVNLKFYQANGPGYVVDETMEFEVTTDASGTALLPNRGITGVLTATGHQLRPNPFGVIDPVGRNGIFIIEMEGAECTNYEWLNIVELNLAYWDGQTAQATFDKTLRCPPPDGAAAAELDSQTSPSYSEYPYDSLPPSFIPNASGSSQTDLRSR